MKFRNFDFFSDFPFPYYHTPSYSLCSCDLRDLSTLEKNLGTMNFDFGVPTLFLAECVMTYMTNQDSDKLVTWCAKKFDVSVFVTYEQIVPFVSTKNKKKMKKKPNSRI